MDDEMIDLIHYQPKTPQEYGGKMWIGSATEGGLVLDQHIGSPDIAFATGTAKENR